MKSIQTLSDQVIDQIAAGEVLERPAHLIKELVENSLDAGSDSIEIDFDRGGQWVKVSDNGHGIHEAEMAKALDRFTTSKISQAGDLWDLKTYGFRGEALASISAVSQFCLISNPQSQGMGFKIESSFGKKSQVSPISAKKGTTIVIDELFSNVPARLKFLKSEAAETTQIKTIAKAMALTAPHVEFRIFQGGKLLHFWPKASSRLDRAVDVLGVKPLYEGEGERDGVHAHSLFSDPHTVTRNSRSLWVFVQNRWVQDRTVQASILEAYRNLLMHGEYPHVVVWVDAPLDTVDVNVHPTKSQVKFLKSDSVFKAVRDSLRPGLETAPWLKVSTPQVRIPEPTVNTSELPPSLNFQFQSQDLGKTFFRSKPETPVKLSDLAQLGDRTEYKTQQGYWSRLQVLGQAFGTYILAQSDGQFLLVDQHAAHERVAFERLMAARRGAAVDVQNFLVPLVVDLDEERVEALKSVEDELAKIGIHFETLSPTSIGVVAAPLLIKEPHLVAGLEKMSHDLRSDRSGSHLEKVIGDILATMACHSVVRAGQALSHQEMAELLSQMDEFPLSSFCPHGRPVSITMTKNEIEKKFGRIL